MWAEGCRVLVVYALTLPFLPPFEVEAAGASFSASVTSDAISAIQKHLAKGGRSNCKLVRDDRINWCGQTHISKTALESNRSS